MSALLDFPVTPEARPYLDAFSEDPREPLWLRQLRRHNLARFAESGFPTRRSESWRYVDLQPLQQQPLAPSAAAANTSLPDACTFDSAWVQIQLVDGTCGSIVRRSPMPEGIWIAATQRAVEQRPALTKALVGDLSSGDRPLASANGALFSDGFAIDIAANAVLDRAIQVIHYGSKSGSIQTRSLINLGEGSRATMIETYAGGAARYWRNDVVIARLAAGAQLTRIVVVEEAAEAIHTALFDARLEKGARLDTIALLLGGHRVRQEWNVCLAGEGAQCRLDGAYIVSSDDEANIVAAVDHAARGGATRELIKGVAADRGHGAFQGKIIVREQAQKTDAHQLSRGIMLGRRAVIDTKPELEILADDVKCSHGASVGDLDEAALFYLRARGLPAEAARRMLLEGFLREAVEGVADAAVRDRLLGRLAARLATLED